MSTGTEALNVTPPGEPSPILLRYMRAAGHTALVGLLLSWVVLYITRGKPYDSVWSLVLAQVMGGRAGGAGFGLQWAFSPYYLLFHICMTDFIIMLYVYPWFVAGYQHLARVPFVGSALYNVHQLALENKERIAPYGAIGLMGFVLFPFWSTGPLVGVVLGYVIGMRTWVTFSAVIFGDVLAAAAWIWFYDRLTTYSESLALGLLIVLLAVAMGGTLATRMRRKRRAAPDTPECIEEPHAPPESPKEKDVLSEEMHEEAIVEADPPGVEVPEEALPVTIVEDLLPKTVSLGSDSHEDPSNN